MYQEAHKVDFRKKLTSIKGLPKKIKNMNYKENLAKIKTMPKKKLAIISVCGVTLIVLAITAITDILATVMTPLTEEFV